MRALIVYNKKSGLWNMFDNVALAKKALGKQCESMETFEIKDWSGEIFQKFKNDKFDLVVAIGGDGTVKTCATLILDYMPEAALRIVPAGSTNVLASSLGMKLSILKSIGQLTKLSALRAIKIDIGRLNSKEYFLEGLIVGYLARVIGRTEQNMKNKVGFGGYLMTFLKHRKCPKYEFQLEIDGREYVANASTLMVINALSVFGLRTRKRIEFADGVFEIGYAKYNTIWGFLLQMIPFFFFKHSKVITWFEGKKIKIIQQDNQPLADAQVDGDMFERTNRESLEVEVLPKALKVLV